MLNIYHIIENTKDSPFLFINITIVVLNFIFFIILNFVIYNKRKKNERDFTIKYEFYKVFVLDKIGILFNLINNCNSIIKEINITKHDDISLEFIREQLDNFDEIQEKIENDIYPNLACYSKDLGANLKTEFETYFDKLHTITTSCIREDVSNQSRKNDFILAKTKLSEKVQELIEKNKPNC